MKNIIHHAVYTGERQLAYEETLCGCKGENPCKNSTDIWDNVDCKRCLKAKDSYIEWVKSGTQE